MNIFEKLSAFTRKAVEVEIGGQTFSFYPPRMGTVLSGNVAKLIEPIVNAIQAAFTDRDDDSSRQYERDENGLVRTTFIQGVPPETIELREKQRAESFNRVISLIFNTDTRYQFANLLADSLREEFDTDPAKRAIQAKKFIDDLSLEELIQFAKGYFKAIMPLLDGSGKSMFSGLQEKIKAEVARQLDRVGEQGTAKLSLVQDEIVTPRGPESNPSS